MKPLSKMDEVQSTTASLDISELRGKRRAHAFGKPRNEMKTQTKTGHLKPFGLRIPDDLKTWAIDQARKERSSLNSWFLRLLDEKRNSQEQAK